MTHLNKISSKSFNPFLLLVAPLLFLQLAHARDLPQACNEDGTLSENSSNIIHRTRDFQRSNIRYPFKTFSTWASHPHEKSMLCFRHEAEALSNRTIQEFRWEDIGQYYGTDIPPPYKEQYEMFSRSNNASADNTIVKAFENSTASTNAWFTVEQLDQRHPTSAVPTTDLTTFNFETSMPEIVGDLQKAALSTNPIVAFQYPTVPREFAPLHTRVTVGTFNLIAVTTAKFDGLRFFITTTMTMRQSKAVFGPALLAVQKSYRDPFDSEDLRKAISLLREFITVPLKFQRGQTEITSTFQSTRRRDFPALFVMEHPVTVQTETQTLCIRISSYSPQPLSVGSQYCNRSAIKRR